MAIRYSSIATLVVTVLSLPFVFFLSISGYIRSSQAIGQACVTPPANILGWWPADENGEDIVNGNDGTLANGAVVVSAQVSQAFQFDGVDDHVHIPNTGGDLDGLSQLTIEAWINPATLGWSNPDSGGFTSSILSKYDSRESAGISYYLNLENGQLRMVVFQDENAWARVDSTDDVSLNTWSHVAGIWYGGNDLSLYINGVEVATTSSGQAISNMAENDTPVDIGRIESFSGSFAGPSAFFHGLIDEVSIYSRALSESEIQAIYNAGSGGKCKGDEPTPTPTLQNDYIQEVKTASNAIMPDGSMYEEWLERQKDQEHNPGEAHET